MVFQCLKGEILTFLGEKVMQRFNSWANDIVTRYYTRRAEQQLFALVTGRLCFAPCKTCFFSRPRLMLQQVGWLFSTCMVPGLL